MNCHSDIFIKCVVTILQIQIIANRRYVYKLRYTYTSYTYLNTLGYSYEIVFVKHTLKNFEFVPDKFEVRKI
jgi:hypothetical protein